MFGSSDLVAFGALTEARLRGIAVPEQLAVCGFGDFELSRSGDPPFTTVRVDGAEIGRIAAEQLLARMNGAATPGRVLLPFTILPRGST